MERHLSNFTPRGSGIGKPAVAFLVGLVFLVLGSLVTGIGMHLIPVEESSVNAPRWILTSVGAVFGLVGILILGKGVDRRRRLARRNRLLAARPDEPWHADHTWSPRGETWSGLRPIVRGLGGTLFLALFLVPFNWWAYLSGHGPVMVMIIVGIFDAALVLSALYVGLLLLRCLRYGRCELLYESFPFSVGGEVALRFRRSGAAAFRRLTFVLRCVEERVETTGSGKNRSTRVVGYARHEQERVLEEVDGAAVPGKDVPLRFEVPAGAPGTKLAESPPVYWELTVHGETGGPDLVATFLVPVYS
jgi:hypothetical protein